MHKMCSCIGQFGKGQRESTFIMPRGGGGGVKTLRGAPKYFLALKGGAPPGGSESSRYTEGGL